MIDYPRSKQSTVRRVLVVLAATVFALTIGLGATASASTNSKAGDHKSVVQRFAEQAKAAGLSDTQARGLQAKVDRYVREHGGTQVSANRILLSDGRSSVLLTAPGEKRARDLSKPIGPQANCPTYYFCAYSGQNYTGSIIYYYYCYDQSMPWGGYGSYQNHQTSGTVAVFKDSNRNPIGYSCRARCAASSIYWTPIWYIDPC